MPQLNPATTHYSAILKPGDCGWWSQVYSIQLTSTHLETTAGGHRFTSHCTVGDTHQKTLHSTHSEDRISEPGLSGPYLFIFIYIYICLAPNGTNLPNRLIFIIIIIII